MSEFGIAQLVGAIMGAVTAVTIAGIIRLLNSDKDIDF
jgi:hypothetical protein